MGHALYAYFDKEAENNQAARVLTLDHYLKDEAVFSLPSLDSLCKFNAIIFQSSIPMLPSLQAEVI